MPNHIKNRIEVIGTNEQVKAFFEMFNTHVPSTLDLNYEGNTICIKSTPDSNNYSIGWLNETTGVFKRRGESDVNGLPDGWERRYTVPFDHFPDFNKVIPQPDNIFNGDLGAAEEAMCLREGRPTWYDWNNENWGTKWNSYSCHKESDNVFTFETAWKGVPNIVTKMSVLYPDVELIYEYADEDTGHNIGSYVFKNGWVKQNQITSGSREAYELAFKLRPEDSEYYQLVNGNYEYKEDKE